MRAPPKLTSPRAGGTSPMIAFIAVDLPAPLRPSSATTSPALRLERHAVQDMGAAVVGVQVRHGACASGTRTPSLRS